MRPEEALCFEDGRRQRRRRPFGENHRVAEHGTAEIVEYTKSDSSYRTVPIDDYTSREIADGIEEKKQTPARHGHQARPKHASWRELTSPHLTTLKKQWQRFVEKGVLRACAPDALRHTFATINSLGRREHQDHLRHPDTRRRPIRSTSMWATSPRQAGAIQQVRLTVLEIAMPQAA